MKCLHVVLILCFSFTKVGGNRNANAKELLVLLGLPTGSGFCLNSVLILVMLSLRFCHLSKLVQLELMLVLFALWRLSANGCSCVCGY